MAFATQPTQESTYQPKNLFADSPVPAQTVPAQTDESRIMRVLHQNSDKNFVQRILSPQGKPTLDLPNGQFATHKMSWATMGDDKPIVYPNVIQDPKTGKLVELSSKDAVDHAVKTKQFIPMGNDKDAEWFSSNYKKVWDMDGKNIKLKKGLSPSTQAVPASDYQPRNLLEGQDVTQVSQHDDGDKQSMLGSLMLGGHMGMMEVAARATQAGADLGEITKGMPKGTEEEFTRQFNQKYLNDPHYLASIRQHPIASFIGETAGSTVPLLSIPYGLAGEAVAGAAGMASEAAPAIASVATKAAPWLARGTESALMGLSQYDPTGKEAKQQAVTGAALGIALPPVLQKVAKGLGSVVDPAVMSAARKFGTQLSPYPKLEKALSKLPGSGIKKVISQRGKDVAGKGEELAKKIIDAAGGKPVVGDNGVETGYAKHFTGKLLKQYEASKRMVGGLKNYLMDKADEVTKKKGIRVDALGMNMAAEKELTNQLSLPVKNQDTSLIKDLKSYTRTAESPSKLILPKGMAYEKPSAPDSITYRAADTLKKQLDEKIQGFSNPMTSIQSNKLRMYSSIRNGLKDDINAFAEDAGKEFKGIQDIADTTYSNRVAPFKKAPYSKLLSGGMNSGQFISKFIKPIKEVAGGEEPEDIHKLLTLMPDSPAKTKTAMRAAIMARSLEHAALPGGGVNGKKLADEAMKLSKASGGVFSEEQKDVIKGYQILTHHLEKYQPSVTDISKLQRTTGRITHIGGIAGGLGMAFFHPYLAGAAYTSALGVSKLFTTKAGQMLLKNVAKYGGKAGSASLNPYVTKGLKLILTKEVTKGLSKFEQGINTI